jgi:hypothetical protein
MALAFQGSVPVSLVNIGLAASVPALDVQVEQLGVDIVALAPAVTGQLELSLNPPDLASLTANLSGQLDPLEVGAQLLPGTMPTLAADASVDLAIELALVEAKLAVAAAVRTQLAAGVAAPGISGWSYAGSALDLGQSLEVATAAGFGRTAADAEVRAMVVATESPASWSSFSEAVHTGDGAEGLQYLGELGGGQWNTGVADLLTRIDLFVAALEGRKSAIQVQLQVMAGAELPDPQVVVDAGLDAYAELGVDGLLDNLINVQTDFDAEIGSIQLRLDLLVSLLADINAQLSAGGLALWSYSGSAASLGSEMRGAVAQGVPGGSGRAASVQALVLCGTPANMTTLGNIFAT